MADFDNGYADVTTLQGRELFLLYDPLFREGLNITVESFVAEYGVSSISDVPGLTEDLAIKQTAIDLNTAKPGTFLGITNEIALTIVPGIVGIGLSQTVKDQIAANVTGVANNATAILDKASLTADQTFTGANTFSSSGGVLSDTFAGISNAGNRLHIFSTNINIDAGYNTRMSINSSNGDVNFNSNQLNADFRVHGNGMVDGLAYNSGTNTLTSNATNFVGVAGNETGTWTPTFSNAGTVDTVTATYNKIGNKVTCHCEVSFSTTSSSVVFVQGNSLPFTRTAGTDRIACGTFFSGTSNLATQTTHSGIVTIAPNVIFLEGTTYSGIIDDYLAFTLTYETN